MSYFLGAFNLVSHEFVRSRSALILGEPGFAMHDRGTERVVVGGVRTGLTQRVDL